MSKSTVVLLHTHNLHTVFGGPYCLDLLAGHLAVLQGPSGCGKSLLLRALADLDSHHGEVHGPAGKQSDLPAPAWRSVVAYVPAESGWWDDQVGPHLQAHPRQQEWLQQLGLSSDCLEWQIDRCSTGERQRLALLAALCRDPQILLLDEPTAACDEHTTRAVEHLLRQWLQEGQRSMLMISHDLAQSQRLADRRWRMDASGRLTSEDSAHG